MMLASVPNDDDRESSQAETPSPAEHVSIPLETEDDTKGISYEVIPSVSVAFDFRCVRKHPPAEIKEAEVAVVSATEPSWDANKVYFSEFEKNGTPKRGQEWTVFDDTGTVEEVVDDAEAEKAVAAAASDPSGNMDRNVEDFGRLTLEPRLALSSIECVGHADGNRILPEQENGPCPPKNDELDPIGWPRVPEGFLNAAADDPFASADEPFLHADPDDENLLAGGEAIVEDKDRVGTIPKEKRVEIYTSSFGDDSSQDEESHASEDKDSESEDEPDEPIIYKCQTDDDDDDFLASIEFKDYDVVKQFPVFDAAEVAASDDSNELPTERSTFVEHNPHLTEQVGPVHSGGSSPVVEHASAPTLLPDSPSSGADIAGQGSSKPERTRTAIPLIAPPPESRLRDWEANKTRAKQHADASGSLFPTGW